MTISFLVLDRVSEGELGGLFTDSEDSDSESDGRYDRFRAAMTTAKSYIAGMELCFIAV